MTRHLLLVRISSDPSTYHLAQQKDILAAHEEDSARDIGVKLSSVDSLNRILQNKVRYKFAPA
jgi:hypothetical protein